MRPDGNILGTFFDGTRSYNVVALVVGIFGLLVSIVGFILTIAQLLKTKAAAQAAQAAAHQASEHLARIDAFVDVSKLHAIAAELATLLNAAKYAAAHVRAGDLRQGIQEVRESRSGQKVRNSGQWQELVTLAVTIHEKVQQLATTGNREKPESQLRKSVDAILDQLTQAKAAAVRVAATNPLTGANNARS